MLLAIERSWIWFTINLELAGTFHSGIKFALQKVAKLLVRCFCSVIAPLILKRIFATGEKIFNCIFSKYSFLLFKKMFAPFGFGSMVISYIAPNMRAYTPALYTAHDNPSFLKIILTSGEPG